MSFSHETIIIIIIRSVFIFWDMLSFFLHVMSEDELFKCIPEPEP